WLRLESSKLVLDRNRQATNAFANLVWRSIGEIKPKVPAPLGRVAVAGIERIAGHEGDVLLERRLKELVRIHPLRQRDPQEQASLRMSPAHFCREVLLQSLHHHIAPLAIDAADQLDVLVEEVVAR